MNRKRNKWEDFSFNRVSFHLYFVFKKKKKKVFYSSLQFVWLLLLALLLSSLDLCTFFIQFSYRDMKIQKFIHFWSVLKSRIKKVTGKRILPIGRATIIIFSVPSTEFEMIRNSVLFNFPNVGTKAWKKTQRITLLMSP